MALSKIQTLPAELKLHILEDAANILVLKNLVLACPTFYPVYCRNRYSVLLNAHRKSQDKYTDVLADILLNVHNVDGTDFLRRDQAWKLWRQVSGDHFPQNEVNFVDRQPSLSDLIVVSRTHCWVVEKAEVFFRTAEKSKALMDKCLRHGLFRLSYMYLYYIEIFAAIIGEKVRGWPAASLPMSRREEAAQGLWNEYDFDRMSDFVKVIWPNRFNKTPPCRRRTRVLIKRNARQLRGGVIYCS